MRHYLKKIDEGMDLNAFIFVLEESARRRAREIDKKIKHGKAGKLAGAIIAVKDLIAMRDQPLTCGSRILDQFISPYDANVVEKLRGEDAIIIGKTNLDEFGMGSSNENSFFGPVRNPHDLTRVAGGSSGGSCAAVASAMAIAALGTDTGGSIRQPAAFCGVVGLKPTYGRISRYGLAAFSSSCDQIGPIAGCVDDAALLLQVMAGQDPNDATSANRSVPDFSRDSIAGVEGLRIGLPREYFEKGLAPDVAKALDKMVVRLRQDGAQVADVSLPHTDHAIAVYYLISTAEASSNLARYDGARYGFRAEDVQSLEEMYVESRSQGFGDEVKRRIMLGTYVLSAGYQEAYYRKAQQVRTLIGQDFENVFAHCDCLLTPTTPTPAFKLGEKTQDPLTMYLSDVYTVPVNLVGLPAISVPCGTSSEALPIGAQVIGKPFDEEMILRVGRWIERAS